MNQEKDCIYICRAKRCRGNGSDEIVRLLETVLKTKMDSDEESPLGINCASVLCLGHCEKGPNIRVDDKVYNKVDKSTLKRVLALIRADQKSRKT